MIDDFLIDDLRKARHTQSKIINYQLLEKEPLRSTGGFNSAVCENSLSGEHGVASPLDRCARGRVARQAVILAVYVCRPLPLDRERGDSANITNATGSRNGIRE